MFIKKDLRKIPQILDDATSRAVAAPSSPDPANEKEGGDDGAIVTSLRFARRAPEFLPAGNVALLLEPRYRPALDNLVQLSLYDCGLQSLAGIEQSGGDGAPLFPKLEQLDVGRNPKLTNDSLPESFHTQFPKMTELWLDDCGFGPNIPSTLLEMELLQVVRMTGNQLQGELEDGIGIRYWKNVKVLALDGNKLTSVGRGIGRMQQLEKLHLRSNNLTSLPEGVPGEDNANLTQLSLSSNQLKSVPASLIGATALKELYLNGNQLEELPVGIANKLLELKKLNLAHNSIGKDVNAGLSQDSANNDGDAAMADVEDQFIDSLPFDFYKKFGLPEALSGNCTRDAAVVVRLEGNPIAEAIRKQYLEEEKRKAKESAMETEAVE
ncbi:hypothetical protein ACHAXT_013238 [Thalassiosira profunda]